MEQKARQMAELLKVLANENRLLILCALMKEERTVSNLGECVPNISQSALSQHLALLKAHGILDCTKSGLSVTYFISDQRVDVIMSALKEYFCCNL